MNDPRKRYPDLPERIEPAKPRPMDAQEFYRKHPPDRLMAALAARRRPVLPWLAAFAGAAAAAALAFVLLSPAPEPAPPLPPFGGVGTRTLKGTDTPDRPLPESTPVLRVEVRRGGAFAPLADDGSVRPGDVIRLLYDAADYDYLCVLSLDGRGGVEVWYPDGTGTSVPIVRGRNIPLPGAIELDDYVGPEHLIALFSTGPVDAVKVRDAVRQALASGDPSGASEAAVLRAIQELRLRARLSTVLLERRLP